MELTLLLGLTYVFADSSAAPVSGALLVQPWSLTLILMCNLIETPVIIVKL